MKMKIGRPRKYELEQRTQPCGERCYYCPKCGERMVQRPPYDAGVTCKKCRTFYPGWELVRMTQRK